MENSLNVLFVSRGKKWNFFSQIIKNQGTSLERMDLNVQYYVIKGKGIKGYIRTIPRLRKKLKSQKYDIIHAHYSLSAFVATLAGAKPLVVSLMGGDVKNKTTNRLFIKFFARFFWKTTIVKSQDMKDDLKYSSALIVPNGVDLEKFKPMDSAPCQQQLGWDSGKKHILFASSPSRPVKNFSLAKATFNLLEDSCFELHYLENIPHDQMPIYHNAADIILLTSIYEGSPNVIKEAMACNCPIVSSNVGDVRWVLGDTNGCFITSFDLEDVAKKIKKSLEFSENMGRTKGRDRIIELGLDSVTTARKIIAVYKKC